VTVAHEVADVVLDRAFDELADYQASFDVGCFGLFERGPDGVWTTAREYPLCGRADGPPGPDAGVRTRR
jgi:hypothetical protein